MSYFFAGFNVHDKSKIEDINNIYASFISLNESINVSGSSVFAKVFHQNKKIKDIFIRHKSNESWMMIIGMPLLRANTNEEKQILIDNYFTNPKKVIRDEIDGHYVIMAFDDVRKRFIIATDFNNFIPVYYTVSNQGCYFCSDEIPVAKLVKADHDILGFSQAVQLGVTWGAQTRFNNIHKMRPCELLSIDENNIIQRYTYWEPQEEELWGGSFDSVIDKWLDILSSGVLKFYNSAEVDSITADMTAGEDARLIVAQCYALKIPFKTRVCGFPGDKDILIAEEASKVAGFGLEVNYHHMIDAEQIINDAQSICLETDGYGSLFTSSIKHATNQYTPPPEYDRLHFCGVPGGEVYRGSYYLRAKLLFPNLTHNLDYRFFTRLKYLLDYIPGLLVYSDKEFIENTYEIIRNSLQVVEKFPSGIKVDHLLREFQNCTWGLSVRQPFYMPMGLKDITRTIYNIPPSFKRGGKLTKACTEKLFPELAHIKTQHGVPTIRKTITRLPKFMPEYISHSKKIFHGVAKRLFKYHQNSMTLAVHHRLDYHAATMSVLLNSEPYNKWFESSDTMLTGQHYRAGVINDLLKRAREGQCYRVQILGRIINQELAYRFVKYDNDHLTRI